jgi:hypothetical protein
MKKYIYKTLFICVLAIGFTACKSRQQIIRSDARIADKSANELFNDILANQFTYNTFSARLNINLSMGTRSISSRAHVRIVHDNALQISVQPVLGIEMFRLYIDPDSAVIVDRMNRRYVHESIASLKEIYPVGFDFHTLQSLFTNALFVAGKSNVEARDYRAFSFSQTDDVFYLMLARDRRSDMDYSFVINGDDRITQTHIGQGTNILQWNYNNFAMVGNNTFPHRMNVSFTTDERRATAEITFSNIAVNESFQLIPNIPNGFTRTSVSEVMRILTSVL